MMRTVLSPVLSALVLTAVLSSAVAQEPPPAVPPETPNGPVEADAEPATATFEGIPWQLAAFRSGDELTPAIDAGRAAVFRFEDGRLSGSAGCNRLFGGYQLNGDALNFERNMGGTMMACPEPSMEQERLVMEALAAVTSFRQGDDSLELLDVEGVVAVRFAILKPTPLIGTRWQLTTFNNGRQALVSALAGTEITLELNENGTLGGSDGCNRYMSGFVVEGDRLTIGPIATTRKACPRPEGASQQAIEYAAALGTVTGYRIEGQELTLTDADGNKATLFRVAEGAATPGASEEP